MKLLLAMSKKIEIGIIGGSGYVAGELLRILVNHPYGAIKYVQSKSQHDKKVSSIHNDLIGDCQLKFTEFWDTTVDVIFYAGGINNLKNFYRKIMSLLK